MKINALLGGVFAFGLLALGSCGTVNTEPEEPGGSYTPDVPGGNGGNGGNGTDQVYTPEESKRFISSTATEFVNSFNASDQEALIELASDFEKLYSDLDAPDFDRVGRSAKAETVPAAYIKGLARAVRGANPMQAASAAATHVYNYSIDQLSGVYEPGRYSWIKTENSSDVVFRFTDLKGRQCELKATPSSTVSVLNIQYKDYYEDYNYNRHEWEVFYDIVRQKFEIPTSVTVTLRRASETLASTKIDTSIDVSGHNFNCAVVTSISNIGFESTVTGTDSQVSATAGMSYGGKNLVSATGGIRGKDLCNLDKILENIDKAEENYWLEEDDDYFNPLDYIDSGTASVDILGKIQVYGQGEMSRELLNLEMYYDFGGDYDMTQSQALRAITSDIAVVRRYVSGRVRFNNTDADQATLSFQPRLYICECREHGDYTIEPVIEFADGSTATFEDYGRTGFASVEGAIRDVVDAYDRIWNKYARR